jgi:hypothetical protein
MGILNNFFNYCLIFKINTSWKGLQCSPVSAIVANLWHMPTSRPQTSLKCDQKIRLVSISITMLSFTAAGCGQLLLSLNNCCCYAWTIVVARLRGNLVVVQLPESLLNQSVVAEII